MASNPMQRKSRNSFLLGVIVTLLIAGVVIAMLLLMLKQKTEELNAKEALITEVYSLNMDVKAGQVLTEDMFEKKPTQSDLVPSNATAQASTIRGWFLQTKEGESVSRDSYGLYLTEKIGDTRVEVFKNADNEMKDYNGNKISVDEYYVEVVETEENRIVKIEETKNIKQDKNGKYFIDTEKTRLYNEEFSTDGFYIYKKDTGNTNDLTVREKEYIAIKDVPVIARIDMKENTVMTPEFVVQSDETITDDTRQEEYNMITLPVDLMTEDYIDIRLKTPNGQNFIVVSKVQVDVPMAADGTYLPNTIRVKLREDEILLMSSAIVEAYGLLGSELYVTKYVDPAMQVAATPTYIPNAAVTAQINANPNIVQIAKEELAKIGTNAAIEARNKYLQQAIDGSEDYMENIPDAVEESMGISITTRQQYLESLNQEQ